MSTLVGVATRRAGGLSDPAPAVGAGSTGTELAVLSAARVEFERHGMRRANMDAIAKRAGVSRRTLYRRFPTKEALFEQLVEGETLAMLGQLGQVAHGQDAPGAIVECFTLAMHLITENRLARTIIENEPELIIGLNTPSGEKAIVRASALVAATLRRSGATMPDDAVLAVSEILVRLVGSLLTNRAGTLDITDNEAVRGYARTYLARLVW